MRSKSQKLNYVHASGVVHRDVKPENIRVDPAGRVKLMDFGIAKTAGLTLTRTGMTMGTPYYMAPEQVSGRPADALVDVYAFGMLLFELLTGMRGVSGETMEAVFYQILTQPLDVAALENAGAPPAVRELVMRCTAKSASDRPQGFPEVIEVLRGVLSGDTPPTRPEISPAGPMWRLSLITYGLVLLVTLVAVFAWRWLKPPDAIPGMVYVPAGTFLSGEDKHPVALKAFYIDETEVTNAEFARYCRTVGQTAHCEVPTAAPYLPVVNVSYALAGAYAKSFGKRLPSPLEWERAARGTQGDLFPWGDKEDPALANVLNNPSLGEKRGLMPARSFVPHRGSYQMVGNAWEMVEGEVKPSVQAMAYYASLLNPAPTADEPWITIRGGSFNQRLTPGIVYDSASIPERYTAPDIGFRCVKDP